MAAPIGRAALRRSARRARAGGFGRRPGPFIECAEERIRIPVAGQEGDLTGGQVRAIEVMPRELRANYRRQDFEVCALVAERTLREAVHRRNCPVSTSC
ncbi:hypothetical protein [Burkholderia cepacia]|uniref:hypothetical protein n=1 Tax=Burkholderia cepacia TaxID=292 RepID=UPI0012D2FD4E|nr:hypothetical protein [Burkholderia cepacia]